MIFVPDTPLACRMNMEIEHQTLFSIIKAYPDRDRAFPVYETLIDDRRAAILGTGSHFSFGISQGVLVALEEISAHLRTAL
jgi:hypothetical protein